MRRTVRALFENPQELRAEDVAKSEVLKNIFKGSPFLTNLTIWHKIIFN